MSTIPTRILNGEADGEFEQIQAAIKQRRKTLGTIKMAGLKPGDKVTVSAAVRPKYLAGATATVVRVKQSNISVRLDQPVGRFQGMLDLPSTLLG